MSNMVNYNAHSCIVPAVVDNGYGVFIQDIKGRLWKTEDWDNSAKPNAVAVIAKEDKFLIALSEPKLCRAISSGYDEPLEDYMATSVALTPKTDYDGAGNTSKILKMQSSTDYAAGYCNSFILPDGKTKGYLPSFGQMNLAYRNKAAIDAALSKCGGTIMGADSYWTSTFWGVCDNYRYCWLLNWSDGNYHCTYLSYDYSVRPFADFNN